jgi:pre-mRNA-splicing regulator WTAP
LILEQALVEEKEKKIKELQDNVSAVNFTASSKLGKMLMAKCRTLQAENEEIGEMASEGKVCPLLLCYLLPNSVFFLI